MANLNSVTISGNLTRDPELRTSASGGKVLSFGIAVNERKRKPGTDEYEDYPNFFDIDVFGGQADYLARILKKGVKVAVEGRLHYSSWEKDGARRSKVTIIARGVDPIYKVQAEEASPEEPEDSMAYEDIPF